MGGRAAWVIVGLVSLRGLHGAHCLGKEGSQPALSCPMSPGTAHSSKVTAKHSG